MAICVPALTALRCSSAMARATTLALLTLAATACASSAPSVSAQRARTPTPKSVTPDNPAGDAVAPDDAALERLLSQPIGIKRDYFNTLGMRFPDARSWRRVRIWGHPSRAAFRYGREHYAVAVVDYRDAQSDEPTACLEQFVREVRGTADKYDLEIDSLQRRVSKHWKGVESLDHAQLAADRKRRVAEAKKRLQQRREAFKKRMQAMAKLRARLAALRAPPKTWDERLQRLSAKLRRIRWALEHEPATRLSFVPPGRLLALRPPSTAVPPNKPGTPNKPGSGKPAPRPMVEPKPRHGYADMPAIKTAGHFSTMIDRDRYVGAAVAYRSWPGTCLVQGFAVRVGTDETLADKVVERWLKEAAPRLGWRQTLRAAPPREDR